MMDALKENSLEIEIGSSVDSFQKFLDSQRELFHTQIEQLQNVVVRQCRLTGVNPLSQEMAAGALSIKIGKRPRDLINPKAIKYMQAVFSVKDAISKKESREISAQFGVTVTQVKDFFNSQRSRVRKLVRLSREKAIRSNALNDPHGDGIQIFSDSMVPIGPVPLSTAGPTSSIPINPVPLNSISTPGIEEAPSCSGQDDYLAGIDDLDKHFVDNIFSFMRKEETFSGQVKLMEWILQIENSSVLFWFLNKGGVMILATWLSQAADEEQTSVLVVILTVLSHLPLHKALPEHMSAILQSVNRLRFYRAPDISNRARILLSKWSKMFARSQAMKKRNGLKSSTDTQNELILKQSIGEIMADETWQSNTDGPEAVHAPSYENLENSRKLESPQALKLLTASSDDPTRKNILGVSSSYNRERRKVQLVEQPGQKMASRSLQATRPAAASQGRPMSADDIQKAKLRAQYMQNKYGKAGSTSNESNEVKAEGLNRSTTTQAGILPLVSKVHGWPKIEEHKKPVTSHPKVSGGQELPLDPKHKTDIKEPLQEKCKRVQISWQTPPEVKLNVLWRVSAGENSKEIEVQKNRNHREKETIYHTIQEIPSNPKEPWDLEMDYDDTLTLEIPTEQPPEAESGETQVATANVTANNAASSVPISSQVPNGSSTEPDLELLAVLLKNPELVFALTSGPAGNLSSEDTVKLLDMIKAGGAGLAGNLNGIGGKVEERVEVSLPSPTPSSNPGTRGWRQEVVRNPFTRKSPMQSDVAYGSPGVESAISSTEKLHTTNLMRGQVPAMNMTIPQQPTSVPTLSQQHSSLHLTNAMIPEKQQPSVVHSLHQPLPTNSPYIPTQASEIPLSMKNLPFSSISAKAGPSMRVENVNNLKVVPVPVNAPERQPVSYSLPSLMPTSTRSQTQPQQSRLSDATHVTPLYTSRPSIGNLGPISDSWIASQHLAANPPYQANQNNNASFGGPVQQPQLLAGPSREGKEYMSSDGFESWSPENSPTRPSENSSGRNYPDPNMGSGLSYRPDRSRHWDSSGYQEVRDYNKHGNRRWRDRRR